jgi:hypothetical protein
MTVVPGVINADRCRIKVVIGVLWKGARMWQLQASGCWLEGTEAI